MFKSSRKKLGYFAQRWALPKITTTNSPAQFMQVW